MWDRREGGGGREGDGVEAWEEVGEGRRVEAGEGTGEESGLEDGEILPREYKQIITNLGVASRGPQRL